MKVGERVKVTLHRRGGAMASYEGTLKGKGIAPVSHEDALLVIKDDGIPVWIAESLIAEVEEL